MATANPSKIEVISSESEQHTFPIFPSPISPPVESLSFLWKGGKKWENFGISMELGLGNMERLKLNEK
ncbi:hypothetical protein RHGRI_035075 [Rhododendron griersonianum]|uniref:Uncharacterized protein n=1 Tax=Rhododendron griersonianum TaxID=479676 RepID=A0AAV6I5X9_9ERIC|nr:hypothetical protein RHGRI_035075 [Rhododendron griersonianum]